MVWSRHDLPSTALRQLRETPALTCSKLLRSEADAVPWAETPTAYPAPEILTLPVLTSDLRGHKYN